MDQKTTAWTLALLFIVSVAPADAGIPIKEGQGYEGASTCYNPEDLMTRWTQDGYVKHRYAQYFWLPNKQDGVTATCEKFEGGLEVAVPGTGKYYNYGELVLDLATDVPSWYGYDTDIDGDGSPDPHGPYERIIEDVGQGDVFVLHGWSDSDAFDIDFYTQDDRQVQSPSVSRVGGDRIGKVPAGAEYAEVTLLYPGYWEDPSKAPTEPVARFDYYEASFEGSNLCSMGDIPHRAGSAEDDPHMTKVSSGTKGPQGYLYLNYSYQPGHPIITKTYLHNADDYLRRISLELENGTPRHDHGPQSAWNGPHEPGRGQAITVSANNGPSIGYDDRDRQNNAERFGYLDPYYHGRLDWGEQRGEYNLIMGTWGGGNATHVSWEVWVDTCGSGSPTEVTGLGIGNTSRSYTPYEYQSSDVGRVDIQADTRLVPGEFGDRQAWVQHGAVELDANNTLWAFMNAEGCIASSYGLNWWEPWQNHQRDFPVRENSCYSTGRVDASGPPGTREQCYSQSLRGVCTVTGPEGSYEIEMTYPGTGDWYNPDGLYVLDIDRP